MVHVQARDRGRRGQHRQRLHVVCYVPDQYEVLGEIQLLLFFLRISNLRAEQLLLLLFLLLLVLKTQGRNRHNHHRHCVIAIVRERRNRFLARVARVLQSLHLQQSRLATGLIVRLVLRLCEHRIGHVVAHERPERVLLRLGDDGPLQIPAAVARTKCPRKPPILQRSALACDEKLVPLARRTTPPIPLPSSSGQSTRVLPRSGPVRPRFETGRAGDTPFAVC